MLFLVSKEFNGFLSLEVVYFKDNFNYRLIGFAYKLSKVYVRFLILYVQILVYQNIFKYWMDYPSIG